MITRLKDIRSERFTRKFPKRCKFRLNEIAELRELTQVTNQALKQGYLPGTQVRVVGMRRETNRFDIYPINDGTNYKQWGSGRNNFYYVKLDKKIFCLPSQHLNKRA